MRKNEEEEAEPEEVRGNLYIYGNRLINIYNFVGSINNHIVVVILAESINDN